MTKKEEEEEDEVLEEPLGINKLFDNRVIRGGGTALPICLI